MNDLAPQKIPIRIVSNLRRLASVQTEKFSVVHDLAGLKDSVWGGIGPFFKSFRADVIVLECDTPHLLVFCLLRKLIPFQRCLMVSLDIVLRRPCGRREVIVAKIKKWLLREVDHFILYFKDLEGYEEHYGISSTRVSYIPFKVNLPEIPPPEETKSQGEYVLTIGRSHRDIQTFIEAMRLIDYPSVLLSQNIATLRENGTEADLSNLPGNLRLQQSESGDGRYEVFARRAKLVVLPIARDCISPAGISSYLLAMAFQKCVIITECPATRGLLKDEAIIVRPGDPVALAEAIRRAWEDDEVRESVAGAGRRYAEHCGCEPRLLRDVVNLCGDLLTHADMTQHRCKVA